MLAGSQYTHPRTHHAKGSMSTPLLNARSLDAVAIKSPRASNGKPSMILGFPKTTTELEGLYHYTSFTAR